jgi:tRNA-2-methylthio-N6-dimethylallyladenosine synthase
MADQVPKAVVQERYERLIALQDEISWEATKALVGREVEVLVSSGEGRKDASTGRVSGRARDGRLVHVATGGPTVAPGDTITSTVTYAAPHHLVADAPLLSHRRWRGAAETAPVAAGPLLTIGPRPSR